MGNKKKAFIDKKRSSTYHLLHRSQRDVAGELDNHGHDDGGGGAAGNAAVDNGMVLWPDQISSNSNSATFSNLASTNSKVMLPNNNSANANGGSSSGSSKLGEWRQTLARAGLLDVDHERYLKPTGTGTGTGGGFFLDAASGRAVPLGQQQQQTALSLFDQEDALVEVRRQPPPALFDCIPLSADCMDADIAAVLFSDDDDDDIFERGDLEELNDDFVLMAAREPEEDEAANDGNGDSCFDYDSHIRKLLEKARLSSETVQQQQHTQGLKDAAYFENAHPLREGDDEDCWTAATSTEPGVVAKLSPDEERALCEKFEQTLAEYDTDDDDDDDENGDCFDNDNDGGDGEMVLRGRPLEGDDMVEAALDDFLQEKEEDIFMQGTLAAAAAAKYNQGGSSCAKRGGSGFAVLVGTHMVPAKELDGAEQHPEQEPALPVDEIFAQARERLAQPKDPPPPEAIFIDGKSYFSERERNPWDCESILSTYSNLDNNPITIAGGTSSRRRQLRKKQQLVVEPASRIRLSAKTGLPIVKSEQDDDGDDDDFVDDTTSFSVNKGERRSKTETPEEKKGRKLLIKRERQLARIQKKMTKEVFREEFEKHAIDVGADDVAGKTVFRF